MIRNTDLSLRDEDTIRHRSRLVESISNPVCGLPKCQKSKIPQSVNAEVGWLDKKKFKKTIRIAQEYP